METELKLLAIKKNAKSLCFLLDKLVTDVMAYSQKAETLQNHLLSVTACLRTGGRGEWH